MIPDARVVFGIIMGTGVGGGVVVDGKVIHGRHGIGGEFGHIKTEENDIICYCGHTGCNENVMSGPALEKYYAGISGSQKTCLLYTSSTLLGFKCKWLYFAVYYQRFSAGDMTITMGEYITGS